MSKVRKEYMADIKDLKQEYLKVLKEQVLGNVDKRIKIKNKVNSNIKPVNLTNHILKKEDEVNVITPLEHKIDHIILNNVNTKNKSRAIDYNNWYNNQLLFVDIFAANSDIMLDYRNLALELREFLIKTFNIEA